MRISNSNTVKSSVDELVLGMDSVHQETVRKFIDQITVLLPEKQVLDAIRINIILAGLHVSVQIILANFLSRLPEDKVDSLEHIGGSQVTSLANKIRQIRALAFSSTALHKQTQESELELVRRYLLSFIDDISVLLVILSEKLYLLRVSKDEPESIKRELGQEILKIYAPLANRLGLAQLKWEMEDLAFRFVNPGVYKDIASKLDLRRVEREVYIHKVVDLLQSKLAEHGFKFKISGRPKHIYSIWRKMYRKHIGFEDLFDIHAVRVLVESVEDCYKTLSVIHEIWNPIREEYDDYIARPKSNNYQSLHTAVYGPEGQVVEVQIRTFEMHEHAELGVAAHWRYKEGEQAGKGLEEKINRLRSVMQGGGDSDSGMLEKVEGQLFSDRVFVFTPKGKLFDLPKGSTPLDFAYEVHTEVGHHTRGAKVNSHIVPLTYELKTGDMVEVLTSDKMTPSRDWMSPVRGYLVTSKAIAKVRQWFNQSDNEVLQQAGRQLFEKELRKREGGKSINMEHIARSAGYKSVDLMMLAIGKGQITVTQLLSAWQRPDFDDQGDTLNQPRIGRVHTKEGGVKVMGVGGLMTHMAGCCKPVPYENIVGFITRGSGVTIHKDTCENINALDEDDKKRLIAVEWTGDTNSVYPVDIMVSAYDRHGLLRDITMFLAGEKINVTAVSTVSDHPTNEAHMRITIEVKSKAQLNDVLQKIASIKNVYKVSR